MILRVVTFLPVVTVAVIRHTPGPVAITRPDLTAQAVELRGTVNLTREPAETRRLAHFATVAAGTGFAGSTAGRGGAPVLPPPRAGGVVGGPEALATAGAAGARSCCVGTSGAGTWGAGADGAGVDGGAGCTGEPGVAGIDATLATDDPTALCATTVTVYGVPLVSPAMVQEVTAARALVHDRPPGCAVAV